MIFKENANILEDLLRSSEVITKIRNNYLKEFNSYLKITKAPGLYGDYQVVMNRDYIDETIKTKLSRIFSFIKPSVYKRYVNMAIIGTDEITRELSVRNSGLDEHREEVLLNLGFLVILEREYCRLLGLHDKVIDIFFNEIAEFKLNCLLYCFSRKKEITQDEHSSKYGIKELIGLDYFSIKKFKGCYGLILHVDSIENNKLNGKFIMSKYGYSFSDKEKAFEVELNLDNSKEAIFLNRLKSRVNARDKSNPDIGIINESYDIGDVDIRSMTGYCSTKPYIEFFDREDKWFIQVNDLVDPKIYCIPDNNIEVTEVKEDGIIYTIIKNFSYNQEIKLMCRMSDVPFLNIE